eukprot:2082552-Pyramimonas_sp.AAC.1
MKNSPYFVPQTQCNEQGVPQGAYFDFTKFIADQGMPTGAAGFPGGRVHSRAGWRISGRCDKFRAGGRISGRG